MMILWCILLSFPMTQSFVTRGIKIIPAFPNLQQRKFFNGCICAQSKVFRPSLDDIERISRGQASKNRGVGSRVVPHRLNESERKEWEISKRRRFVCLRGTGWRRERGDSPLANSFRNYCDALGIPNINFLRAIGVDKAIDTVIVDFSTLRDVDKIYTVSSQFKEMAQQFKKDLVQTEDNLVDILQYEPFFKEFPIWRIPVLTLTFQYDNNRQQAKSLASTLAQTFAGATQAKQYGGKDEEYEKDLDIDEIKID
jgi:hypothetical protein